MANKTRVGAVSYLNTRPLVHGFERGLGKDRIDLVYDVPSGLADDLSRGALDIALLPVIELARIPDLELVPGLAIGTFGPARSVLLVAGGPLDGIRTVEHDADSRTSNALVQVLLDRVWRLRPEMREPRASDTGVLGASEARVRIGDKALFEPIVSGAEVHDLGAVWTEHTGLPFVFAAWAARRGVIDEDLYRLLHESRRAGKQAIDEIAREYTWRGSADPVVARSYLAENIRFRLGAAEVQAMKRFFTAAAALGLIPDVPAIRFALERRTGCHEPAAGTGRAR